MGHLCNAIILHFFIWKIVLVHSRCINIDFIIYFAWIRICLFCCYSLTSFFCILSLGFMSGIRLFILTSRSTTGIRLFLMMCRPPFLALSLCLVKVTDHPRSSFEFFITTFLCLSLDLKPPRNLYAKICQLEPPHHQVDWLNYGVSIFSSQEFHKELLVCKASKYHCFQPNYVLSARLWSNHNIPKLLPPSHSNATQFHSSP